MPQYIVAVHTGAGNCSRETNKLLKVLCKKVCCDVTQLLSSGNSTTEAAIAGIVLLEDSPLTNAGLGSSITNDKKIRTEASLCSNESGFHCAGDLENIKHPIKIVELMVKETMENKTRYIPPRIMVGQSAVERYSKMDAFVCQTNICTKQNINLFYKAQKYFNDRSLKRRRTEPSTASQSLDIDSKNSSDQKYSIVVCEDSSASGSSSDSSNSLNGVQDTVGVVCIDSSGSVTCATSSGGSVYKYSGRLGQCCVHGAGSYVTSNLGVVTTGNGEQIINNLLAVTLANKVAHSSDPISVLDSCFAPGERKMCGFLMVERCGGDMVTVTAQHTLSNMVIGLMSSSTEKPLAKVITSASPVFLQAVKM